MAKNKSILFFLFLLGSVIWIQCLGCSGDIRNNVVDTIKHYLFVEEATGNNDGYWVEKMQESVGARVGDPWCGCFQGFAFIQNGLKVPKYAARAAAWFVEPYLIQKEEAQKGDVASLYYLKLGRIGHIVNLLKRFDMPGAYVVTGEGNTNREGSREGNKAAKRYRLKKTIHSTADWITWQTKEVRFYKCNMK